MEQEFANACAALRWTRNQRDASNRNARTIADALAHVRTQSMRGGCRFYIADDGPVIGAPGSNFDEKQISLGNRVCGISPCVTGFCQYDR